MGCCASKDAVKREDTTALRRYLKSVFKPSVEEEAREKYLHFMGLDLISRIQLFGDPIPEAHRRRVPGEKPKPPELGVPVTTLCWRESYHTLRPLFLANEKKDAKGQFPAGPAAAAMDVIGAGDISLGPEIIRVPPSTTVEYVRVTPKGQAAYDPRLPAVELEFWLSETPPSKTASSIKGKLQPYLLVNETGRNQQPVMRLLAPETARGLAARQHAGTATSTQWVLHPIWNGRAGSRLSAEISSTKSLEDAAEPERCDFIIEAALFQGYALTLAAADPADAHVNDISAAFLDAKCTGKVFRTQLLPICSALDNPTESIHQTFTLATMAENPAAKKTPTVQTRTITPSHFSTLSMHLSDGTPTGHDDRVLALAAPFKPGAGVPVPLEWTRDLKKALQFVCHHSRGMTAFAAVIPEDPFAHHWLAIDGNGGVAEGGASRICLKSALPVNSFRGGTTFPDAVDDGASWFLGRVIDIASLGKSDNVWDESPSSTCYLESEILAGQALGRFNGKKVTDPIPENAKLPAVVPEYEDDVMRAMSESAQFHKVPSAFHGDIYDDDEEHGSPLSDQSPPTSSPQDAPQAATVAPTQQALMETQRRELEAEHQKKVDAAALEMAKYDQKIAAIDATARAQYFLDQHSLAMRARGAREQIGETAAQVCPLHDAASATGLYFQIVKEPLVDNTEKLYSFLPYPPPKYLEVISKPAITCYPSTKFTSPTLSPNIRGILDGSVNGKALSFCLVEAWGRPGSLFGVLVDVTAPPKSPITSQSFLLTAVDMRGPLQQGPVKLMAHWRRHEQFIPAVQPNKDQDRYDDDRFRGSNRNTGPPTTLSQRWVPRQVICGDEDTGSRHVVLELEGSPSFMLCAIDPSTSGGRNQRPPQDLSEILSVDATSQPIIFDLDISP